MHLNCRTTKNTVPSIQAAQTTRLSGIQRVVTQTSASLF